MAKATGYKGDYFIGMLQQIGSTSIIDGYSFVCKVFFMIVGNASLISVGNKTSLEPKREQRVIQCEIYHDDECINTAVTMQYT